MTLDGVLLLRFQGWSLRNSVARLLDKCNRVVSAIDLEFAALKGKCLHFLCDIVICCFGEREGLVVVSGPDARKKQDSWVTSFR